MTANHYRSISLIANPQETWHRLHRSCKDVCLQQLLNISSRQIKHQHKGNNNNSYKLSHQMRHIITNTRIPWAHRQRPPNCSTQPQSRTDLPRIAFRPRLRAQPNITSSHVPNLVCDTTTPPMTVSVRISPHKLAQQSSSRALWLSMQTMLSSPHARFCCRLTWLTSLARHRSGETVSSGDTQPIHTKDLLEITMKIECRSYLTFLSQSIGRIR